MKLHFRQGLVRYQTDINAQPTFLQKSTLDSQFIDINVSPDPTIIAFAHKNADYVFEEVRTVRNAWGPFTTSATHYLYWDINLLTAELTRSTTLLPPIYSGVAPPAPAVDQHWFDTIATCFKVWNGNKWLEKVRCFAGIYSSSSVIRPLALGTQAGLNVPVEAGNIILDSFYKPLRQSDGSFLTSSTTMAVVGVASKNIRFEAEVLNLMALENIPRYTLVQARAGRRCEVAKSTDFMSRVSGLALEDAYESEILTVVSSGLIRAESFAWPADKINRPIFCGPNGQLTLTPPVAGVVQQVGFVYDVDAIFMNIFPPVILDPVDSFVAPPPPPPLQAPVPNFTVQPLILSAPAPFTVQFANATTNLPATFEWDFTGDGVIDSTLPDPSYTYVAPGTYSVTLKATNSYGTVEVVKANYITVSPGVEPSGFTNLEARFLIDALTDEEVVFVKTGSSHTITFRTRNDGLLTATNVQRFFIVYDMGGTQIQLVSLPPGAVTTRGSGYTQVAFPMIPSMIAGAAVDTAFTLNVPPTAGTLRFEGTVSSPEQDSEGSDNTRSITLGVQV